MDSLKNRYFVRFIDKQSKEAKLPLMKKRTVMRCFFQFLLGRYEYIEICNEAYLDRRQSSTKRDKNGTLVRGFSGTVRQNWYGISHDQKVNQFKEGLYDPENSKGYKGKEEVGISPFNEGQLDDIMTAIEMINDDTFDD